MRDLHQHFSCSFMLALGLLVGVGVGGGQLALAASEEQDAMRDEPTPAAEAAAPRLTGRQVYNTVCIACHSPPGVGGAPALGSADAWAPRIAQGMDTLINHALNGFTGKTGVMPKKGERVDLSDQEVIEAVQYMVEQAAP